RRVDLVHGVAADARPDVAGRSRGFPGDVDRDDGGDDGAAARAVARDVRPPRARRARGRGLLLGVGAVRRSGLRAGPRRCGVVAGAVALERLARRPERAARATGVVVMGIGAFAIARALVAGL